MLIILQNPRQFKFNQKSKELIIDLNEKTLNDTYVTFCDEGLPGVVGPHIVMCLRKLVNEFNERACREAYNQ